MKTENLKDLQAELDVLKWNDTQANGGIDTCGSYAYCINCNKAVEYPCATAKTVTEQKSQKPASDKMIRMRKPRPKKAK